MESKTDSDNGQLNQMSSEQLDEMLKQILESPRPGRQAETVRKILRILEDRERGKRFEITPQIAAAYQKFLRNIGEADGEELQEN